MSDEVGIDLNEPIRSISLRDFQECTVETVIDDGEVWEVRTDNKGIFCLAKSYKVEPKPGDRLKVEIIRGSAIVGITINDEVVFMYTDEQIKEQDSVQASEYVRKKHEEFENTKEQLDKDFEELPEVFKKRIQRFRNANPEFRWEYEPYEMFCCKQAVLMANELKTTEALNEFAKLSFEEQVKVLPSLNSDHSGNTFGTALTLARFFLNVDQSWVWRWHGALCNLVGCESYGDRDEDRTEGLDLCADGCDCCEDEE